MSQAVEVGIEADGVDLDDGRDGRPVEGGAGADVGEGGVSAPVDFGVPGIDPGGRDGFLVEVEIGRREAQGMPEGMAFDDGAEQRDGRPSIAAARARSPRAMARRIRVLEMFWPSCSTGGGERTSSTPWASRVRQVGVVAFAPAAEARVVAEDHAVRLQPVQEDLVDEVLGRHSSASAASKVRTTATLMPARPSRSRRCGSEVMQRASRGPITDLGSGLNVTATASPPTWRAHSTVSARMAWCPR